MTFRIIFCVCERWLCILTSCSNEWICAYFGPRYTGININGSFPTEHWILTVFRSNWRYCIFKTAVIDILLILQEVSSLTAFDLQLLFLFVPFCLCSAYVIFPPSFFKNGFLKTFLNDLCFKFHCSDWSSQSPWNAWWNRTVRVSPCSDYVFSVNCQINRLSDCTQMYKTRHACLNECQRDQAKVSVAYVGKDDSHIALTNISSSVCAVSHSLARRSYYSYSYYL